MLVHDQGIVLRATKYRETSLIIDAYTAQHGRQSFLINGVRSARATTKASILQPLSLIDFIAYHRPNSNLSRLKEVRPATLYSKIPYVIQRGGVGLFIIEVIRQSVKESEANPELFAFLWRALIHLDDTTDSLANIPLSFLVDLSSYVGFSPELPQDKEAFLYFDLEEGIFCRERPLKHDGLGQPETALLKALLVSSTFESADIRADRTIRQQLLAGLLRFYKIHIENFGELKTPKIFHEVLSSNR